MPVYGEIAAIADIADIDAAIHSALTTQIGAGVLHRSALVPVPVYIEGSMAINAENLPIPSILVMKGAHRPDYAPGRMESGDDEFLVDEQSEEVDGTMVTTYERAAERYVIPYFVYVYTLTPQMDRSLDQIVRRALPYRSPLQLADGYLAEMFQRDVRRETLTKGTMRADIPVHATRLVYEVLANLKIGGMRMAAYPVSRVEIEVLHRDGPPTTSTTIEIETTEE